MFKEKIKKISGQIGSGWYNLRMSIKRQYCGQYDSLPVRIRLHISRYADESSHSHNKAAMTKRAKGYQEQWGKHNSNGDHEYRRSGICVIMRMIGGKTPPTMEEVEILKTTARVRNSSFGRSIDTPEPFKGNENEEVTDCRNCADVLCLGDGA